MRAAPLHDGIAAGTIYNDASRKLILSFKHGGRIALAPTLARLMAARLPADLTGAIFVPVPLHRWRLWRRGYNQAALLARELGASTGQPVLVSALKRVKQTPSLGGLGRQQRKAALDGALLVDPRDVRNSAGQAYRSGGRCPDERRDERGVCSRIETGRRAEGNDRLFRAGYGRGIVAFAPIKAKRPEFEKNSGRRVTKPFQFALSM